jgi:geranylgeranyl diphosphate synthase type I
MIYNDFLGFLVVSEKKILHYIIQNYRNRQNFRPDIIEESVTSYIKRGGKRLRPAVLLMACGAVGGDEEAAIPAAAAIELFHTWTLVHDDLIDNDGLRRGQSTVHVAAKRVALENLKLTEAQAQKYGEDVAVLAGDIQHGWSISLFTEKPLVEKVHPKVIFKLINTLQTYVLTTLVHGEMIDVEFGMRENGILDISEDQIINMLWMKTGVLYEFAGMAGALIGKNSAETDDAEVIAIKSFCSNCGVAFQLRDDILGILGKESKLGKPVGSDIREGKKTTIVRTALLNANQKESEVIRGILGKRDASEDEIRMVTKLLVDLGGVQRTYELATAYIEKANPFLADIRDSKYKVLLKQWAYYLVERNF